jgi:hypothetical protein
MMAIAEDLLVKWTMKAEEILARDEETSMRRGAEALRVEIDCTTSRAYVTVWGAGCIRNAANALAVRGEAGKADARSYLADVWRNAQMGVRL